MRSIAQVPTQRGRDASSAIGRRRQIETLVEHLVIPHLALAGGQDKVPARRYRSMSTGHFAGADIEAFVGSLLTPGEDEANGIVTSLLGRGASVDDITLSFLAPAARRLGARWEDDTLDFASVSTGMTRLHGLLHMIGRHWHAGGIHSGRRLLIANNPGETHAFGPLVVAEHFRRAGWDSRFDPTATTASLAREAGAGTLDALGLSCAAERYLDELTTCIRAIRAAARGRAPCLLVGGVVFVGRPELAERVGADATADDAPAALAAVERLLPAGARAH
jgi:methylmalonyl-CoA mutase cobalamin-binding subunit